MSIWGYDVWLLSDDVLFVCDVVAQNQIQRSIFECHNVTKKVLYLISQMYFLHI